MFYSVGDLDEVQVKQKGLLLNLDNIIDLRAVIDNYLREAKAVVW